MRNKTGKLMQLSGWGRHPRITASLLEPVSADAVSGLVQTEAFSGIPRGAGRSYGDSALAETIVSSRYLDHFIEFDRERLTLTCGAGVSLADILKVVVPHDAFLPVLPGTRFVTVGGAIAADIHGKNHHIDGSFCDHVEEFELLLANGTIVRCSRTENQDLFAATCGGMGLTGFIMTARLRLRSVSSPYLHTSRISAGNLETCLQALEEHSGSTYSVAWLDCLARGKRLGRSILFLAEHASDRGRSESVDGGLRARINVPFPTPSILLNRHTVAGFNSLYYSRQSRPKQSTAHYQHFFFPLDSIGNWNRLYGKRGFVQYQLALPIASARTGLQQILERVADSGYGSFLTVLKLFGPGNDFPLSFPFEGVTLALDFKYCAGTIELLAELDRIVLAHHGRLYLAKDARMSTELFQAGYPRLADFMRVKREVDPFDRFSSLQARRLGLLADDTSCAY